MRDDACQSTDASSDPFSGRSSFVNADVSK